RCRHFGGTHYDHTKKTEDQCPQKKFLAHYGSTRFCCTVRSRCPVFTPRRDHCTSRWFSVARGDRTGEPTERMEKNEGKRALRKGRADSQKCWRRTASSRAASAKRSRDATTNRHPGSQTAGRTQEAGGPGARRARQRRAHQTRGATTDRCATTNEGENGTGSK